MGLLLILLIIGACGLLLLATVRTHGLLRGAVAGALMLGAIGFVAGFFGPMVFAPEANQGPLLGFFVTGPLGVVIGAIGGAVIGHRRRKRDAAALDAISGLR